MTERESSLRHGGNRVKPTLRPQESSGTRTGGFLEKEGSCLELTWEVENRGFEF